MYSISSKVQNKMSSICRVFFGKQFCKWPRLHTHEWQFITSLTVCRVPYIDNVPPKLCSMHQMNGWPKYDLSRKYCGLTSEYRSRTIILPWTHTHMIVLVGYFSYYTLCIYVDVSFYKPVSFFSLQSAGPSIACQANSFKCTLTANVFGDGWMCHW